MSPDQEVRMYGNWRRPEGGRGIGGIGPLGTVLTVGGIGLSILWFMTRGMEGIFVLIATVVVVGSIAIRDQYGKSILIRLSERLGWWSAKQAGAHLYRSGPLARAGFGTHQLPGVLAATELSECTDSYGRQFAMLSLAKGRFSVVIATSPDGAALVDQTQVDQWVALYAQWLGGLGDEPGLVAAQVTVESAPDSGTQLRHNVAARLDPDAPQFAVDVLREVVATYPSQSQSVRAWVALTFDAEGRSADEFGREVATRLPHLSRGLEAAGAGVTRLCTAEEICRVVRVAYDPAVASVLDVAMSENEPPELSWQDVGPVSHQTNWDSYRHDSGLSITWEMTDAPRGAVQSHVLSRLLAPHRDISRKRVSLLYRPVSAGIAASLVEKDLDAAVFAANSKNRASQRDHLAVERARKTAQEEASGAGLVNFGMLVTATVFEEDGVKKARAAVDSLKATARVQLRPCFAAQDSAFAACLPLGVVLADLLSMPAGFKAQL